MLGGGVLGLLWVRPHFCWGGVGAAKGLLPCFLVPKGNQPTACTLALWWLKFGPTEGGGGGGAGDRVYGKDRVCECRGKPPNESSFAKQVCAAVKESGGYPAVAHCSNLMIWYEVRTKYPDASIGSPRCCARA